VQHTASVDPVGAEYDRPEDQQNVSGGECRSCEQPGSAPVAPVPATLQTGQGYNRDSETASIRRARERGNRYPLVIHLARVGRLLDIDVLDDEDPFEIDDQAAHLFKHAGLGVDDVYEVWRSDPLFYPAKPPAHWLMVSEVAGQVLVVPLAPPDSGNPSRCRPIGCYQAAEHLARRYQEDR